MTTAPPWLRHEGALRSAAADHLSARRGPGSCNGHPANCADHRHAVPSPCFAAVRLALLRADHRRPVLALDTLYLSLVALVVLLGLRWQTTLLFGGGTDRGAAGVH